MDLTLANPLTIERTIVVSDSFPHVSVTSFALQRFLTNAETGQYSNQYTLIGKVSPFKIDPNGNQRVYAPPEWEKNYIINALAVTESDPHKEAARQKINALLPQILDAFQELITGDPPTVPSMQTTMRGPQGSANLFPTPQSEGGRQQERGVLGFPLPPSKG